MVGQDMVNEDAGSLLSPIILHLQASYTTLQGCIDGWHRRALMHLPGVATAFLQIARYTFETGVADNNNQAITMPAAVTSRSLAMGFAVSGLCIMRLHHPSSWPLHCGWTLHIQSCRSHPRDGQGLRGESNSYCQSLATRCSDASKDM